MADPRASLPPPADGPAHPGDGFPRELSPEVRALARALGDLSAEQLLILAVALHGDVRGGGDFTLAGARRLAGLLAGVELDPGWRAELAAAAVLALDGHAPAVAELLAAWLDPGAGVPDRLGRARAEAWVRDTATPAEIEAMLMACFNALPRRRRVAFLAAAQAHLVNERPAEGRG